jgi:hypothetical protein
MPDWSGWTVTARDDCSTTRELTASVTNGLTGGVTPQTRRVIEVAAGLNYVDASGVWTESQDLVEPLANGAAAAVHGRYSAYFSPAGLNDDAALTIITASNRVYQARVLGIYYFDAQSGRSNLLAAPSDAAVPEILPPNQIVYRGAFDSDTLKADLRYTYTKAALESDVIITRQPKLSPGDCGLNPATTRIQVRHQWLGAPTPRIQGVTVEQAPGPELVDQILDFGDLWFPTGRAFALGDDNSSRGTNAARITLPGAGNAAAQAPVGKEWQAEGGKATLIESVNWSDIAPKLAQLPMIASVLKGPKETMLAAAGRRDDLPSKCAAAWPGIQVADRPYRTPGVVLDYVTFSGSVSYDFLAFNGVNNTYFLQADGYFSGTLTFEAGCIVKYGLNTHLLTYGGVVCYGTQASPSLLTSQGDYVYGENLYGPTGQYATPALWLYYINTNVTLTGMIFRYANTGLEIIANGCGAVADTVANCLFSSCQTGILTTDCNVSLQNSTYCQVSTPISTGSSAQGCANITGSLTDCYPPTITTSPSSQCQFVLPTYNSVTFNAAATPSSCTYTWVQFSGRYFQVVGTRQSLNLTADNLGTTYGGYKVFVYVTDAYMTSVAGGWVGIVDSDAMAVYQHWASNNNNKTCSLWSNRPTTNPPNGLAWDTSCLLYGKTGFTAISQCDDWNAGIRGQMAVTALTPRHGYMRGHGAGTKDYVPFYGFNTNFNGRSVYFCTGDGNNTLVTATVANAYTRCWGSYPYYDWTILIFNADLPSTIQPMQVSYSLPTSYSVIFNTTQGDSQNGYMSANYPPFENTPWFGGYPGGADPDAFPPFNQHATYFAGDSGSPVMLPTTDDVLVFLKGDATSQPCGQMQADMNALSTSVGLTNNQYQMQQYRW